MPEIQANSEKLNDLSGKSNCWPPNRFEERKQKSRLSHSILHESQLLADRADFRWFRIIKIKEKTCFIEEET